jgi:hypothetical protein
VPAGNKAVLPGITYVSDGNPNVYVTAMLIPFMKQSNGTVTVRLQKVNEYRVEQLPLNPNWKPASMVSP